ncbi:golgin subfamily B member 1 [Pelomyxa schiedti]|nr:golgin subfamily B member 1 [Pelomyxa schiedti]
MSDDGGEPTSVRAVVDSINESLANSIPSLVLMLITLQEQNKPPPQELTEVVQGVSGAAKVLADVALGLANEQYGDYPDIQKEIIDAASSVSRCVEQLNQSVVHLKGGNIKAGYSILMDSCKVIAGECINLLAIVYGAAFKKTLYDAKKAQASASLIDASKAPTDPQNFADKVSDLASRAGEVAQQLKDEMADEPSEIRKQQLAEAAAKLEHLSDGVIEQCNNYLGDLDNATACENFNSELDNLTKALANAQVPVLEAQIEIQEQTNAKSVETVTPPPVSVATETPSAMPHQAQSVPAYSAEDTLDQLLGNQSKDIDCLLDALRDSDPEATVAVLKKMNERNKAMLNSAREEVAVCKNPAKGKEATVIANNIEALFPTILQAVRTALTEPTNAAAKKPVESKCAEMKTAINALADAIDHAKHDPAKPAPPPQSHWESVPAAPDVKSEQAVIADHLKKDCEDIVEAARTKNKPAEEKALEQAKQDQAELARVCKNAAAHTRDAQAKDEMETALHAEQDLAFPKLKEKVQAHIASPSEANMAQLTEAAKSVIASAHNVAEASSKTPADTMYESAKEAKKALNDVKKAANNGNVPETQSAVLNAKRELNDFVDRSIQVAKRLRNPQAQAASRVEVHELEALLPELSSNCDRFANDPTNPQTHNDLIDTTDKIERKMESLKATTKANPIHLAKQTSADLGDLEAAIACKDKKEVAKYAKKLVDHSGKLVDEIQNQAQVATGPSAAALQKISNDITNAVPALIKAADQVSRGIPSNTDQTAQVLHSALNNVADSVDNDGAPTFWMSPPAADEDTLDLLGDAESALDDLINAARGAPRKPGGEVDPTQVQEKLPEVISHLEEVAQAIQLPAEEEVYVQGKVLQDLYKNMEQAAIAKDPSSIVAIAKELAENQPKFLAAVKHCGDSSPAEAAKMTKMAESLDGHLKASIENCKACLADPSEANKARVKKAAHDAENAIQIVLDTATPEAEVALQNAMEDARKALAELQRAKLSKDPAALAAAEDHLQEAIRAVMARAEMLKRAGGPGASAGRRKIADALKALNNLLPLLLAASTNMKKDFNDPRAEAEVVKAMNETDRALKDLEDLLNSLPLSNIAKEKDVLKEISHNVAKNDAPAAVAAVKDLAAMQAKVIQSARAAIAERPADFTPAQTAKVEEATRQLEAQLPTHINAVKDALRGNTAEAVERVQKSEEVFQAALDSLKEAFIDPAVAQQTQAVAGAKKHAVEFCEAVGTQNVPVVKMSVAALRQDVAGLKAKLMGSPASPASSFVQHLDDLVGQAEAMTAKPIDPVALGNIAEQIKDTTQKINDMTEAPRVSPAADVKAKARTVVSAAKRAAAHKKPDLTGLLDASKSLANAMGSLAANSRSTARSGVDGTTNQRALAAMALDDLLAGLETPTTTAAAPAPAPATTVNIADLLRDIEVPEPKPAAKPAPAKTAAARPAAAQAPPKTLGAAIHEVANNIATSVAPTKPGTKDIVSGTKLDPTSLVEQMRKMAEAAAAGNRQQLLLTGRSIAACINTLHAELMAQAKKIKDPRMQDTITRSAQAIKNFSIQLKILSTVKAASSGDSPDTDEQIASVTKSLGQALNNGLGAIQNAAKSGQLRL